jgi:hypothetical protein
MYLEGTAVTWYDDNVDGLDHQRDVWLFKLVITGLYCYIHNTASDSDGFRTGFWQRAQPLSTFHFLPISNILPHSLTVAYSQPSVIAPIPA